MVWTEYAMLDGEQAEAEEEIKSELPEGFRAMHVVGKGDPKVEYDEDFDGAEGWEKFGTVTIGDGAFDLGQELAEHLGDEWRLAFDYNANELFIERHVD